MNWYNSRRDLFFEKKNALGENFLIEEILKSWSSRTPLPSIQEDRTYLVRTLVLCEDIILFTALLQKEGFQG